MIRVKINLVNFLSANVRRTYTFYGVNEETIENSNYTFKRITFEFNPLTTTHSVTIEYEQDGLPITRTFNNDNILNISSSYIIFSGNILRSTISDFNNAYLNDEYIDLNQDDNVTLCCYKQQDENDVVNKSISDIVDFIDGHFNSAIGLKNIDIDLTGFYARQFNYVYIEKFSRYYYVDSIEFVSNDFTRLHLKEDVLKSHKDVILSQNAFVTRNASANNPDLVDERLPLENVLSVEYVIPTATPSSNTLVNTTLNLNQTGVYNVVMSSVTTLWITKYTTSAPAGSGLSDLAPSTAKNEAITFFDMSSSEISYLYDAVYNQSDYATYINSLVLLPFNLYDPYHQAHETWGVRSGNILVGDSLLCNDSKFHKPNAIPSGYSAIITGISYTGSSPYFVIADFTYNGTNGNFLDKEPFSNYEIYIAFVGWVKLDSIQILGKRILVYYTLDYKTGMGTAYIYNYTDKKLIWSSNCQLGVKLDVSTSNAIEITRQKQANELNMIMGLVSSALSVGVGVAKGNPVAIAGGVINASKTIASNVNSNRMLFERAQTTFGTSEGILHAPIQTIIRKSYHKELAYQDSSIYEHIQGYPYNAYVNLSNLEGDGYVEIGEIHFDPMGYDIYQDEINEIVSLLQQGVII